MNPVDGGGGDARESPPLHPSRSSKDLTLIIINHMCVTIDIGVNIVSRWLKGSVWKSRL